MSQINEGKIMRCPDGEFCDQPKGCHCVPHTERPWCENPCLHSKKDSRCQPIEPELPPTHTTHPPECRCILCLNRRDEDESD